MKQLTAINGLIRRAGVAVLSLVILLAAANAFGASMHDFNLIALGNLSGTSNVEGRTLVFGDIDGGTKDFAVDANAVSKAVSTPGVSQTDALIVGGQIKSNIHVNNGGVRVGGEAVTGVIVDNSDYITYDDPGISTVLSAVAADITATTNWFDSLDANSTIDLSDFNSAVFTSNPDENNVAVFDVDPSFFGRNGTYDLIGDLDADMFLFRVTGDITATGTALNVFENEFGLEGYQDKIVWYFPELTELTLSNGLGGAVVAPNANLILGNHIDGSVVANNVILNAEVHLPSTSWEPGSTVPEPGTALLLGFGLLGLAGGLRRRRFQIF